jgi:sugar O-acyltransferase (sialic acid O-acetyltransferase NeuD family)
MKQKAILIGAFLEMIELCEDSGVEIIGIIDNQVIGTFAGYPIIGRDVEAEELYEKYQSTPVILSPDMPLLREKLANYYRNIGFKFRTLISPKANVSKSATIGNGSVIQAFANVSSSVEIGSFVKINTYANIMHDSYVGNFTTIAPNAVILGYSKIGESNYIGANCTILPKIKTGENVTIGAGAVVTKNIDTNCVYAGNPAKLLQRNEERHI